MREQLLSRLRQKVRRETTVDEGLTALSDLFQELHWERLDRPIIVAVAGGTASGKTSQIADRIRRTFPDQVTILAVDMFYRGNRARKVLEGQHGRSISWDEPLAIDLAGAAAQLERLRNRLSAQVPVYDFAISEPVGEQTIGYHEIILVEGLFALHEDIRRLADICIYVDVDIHGQIIRRVLRDISRKRREPNDILLDLAKAAIPMQHQYVTTTRQYADLIIKNDYRPETESARQGSMLPQVKVGNWPLPGILTELGAEYLGTLEGADRYYTARDRDLLATGEEFRIRDESGRLMLTYKGPLVGAAGERFVFTCSIEEETVRELMAYYREAFVYVQKSRRLFLLPGALVALDSVALTSPSATTPQELRVTEIRLTGQHPDGLSTIHDLIRRLGLDPDRSTRESYFAIALNPSLLPLE
jgi:uridine kinase